MNIQLKRYYLGVRRSDGVNSLLCNGNSQSSGLIIRRSAKSSRCFSGGVASWSSDALVENSSALAAPFKRLCWELIVEHESFDCSIKLHFRLFCSEKSCFIFFFLSCISLLKWSKHTAVLRISCVQEAASQTEAFASMVRSSLSQRA